MKSIYKLIFVVVEIYISRLYNNKNIYVSHNWNILALNNKIENIRTEFPFEILYKYSISRQLLHFNVKKDEIKVRFMNLPFGYEWHNAKRESRSSLNKQRKARHNQNRRQNCIYSAKQHAHQSSHRLHRPQTP